MKVLTVVGARPQFVKAAPVSCALQAAGHDEFLLHTGQHYDPGMSDVFFDELGLPAPSLNLGVGSGTHGQQTAAMLTGIEQALLEQKPDWILLYGDTNSTLAGALAACKLRIPIAHVEAGLRSYNRAMPEEHNRVVTDHCSDLLLCPTPAAVSTLKGEGITRGVYLVGDPMFDAALQFGAVANERSGILTSLGVAAGGFALATLHRPYNTDDPAILGGILRTLSECGETIVLPLHPRTRSRIEQWGLENCVFGGLRIVEPLGYLDMLALEQAARLILTDSGGIQKEALFFGKPCVTLRPETEWVETVESGWNMLAGADPERIIAGIARRDWPGGPAPQLYGDGRAAVKIVEALEGEE